MSFIRKQKEKFLHGFYSDAVFTATKILMQRLKVIHREIDSTGCDIDGLDLVGKLFPNDNPKIFSLNKIQEQSKIYKKDTPVYFEDGCMQ